MKALSRAATTAFVAVALASPCWAGQVKLDIRGGQVTLSAKDATVREILAEWARVGQTRIVNAERIGGGLLTLDLNGVPEAKALDTVLRSVAGYVAAPRMTPATGDAPQSRFDRIVIMAVPRPAAGGASPVAAAPSTPSQFEQRRMGYQPQPSLMVDDQDEPVVQQPQPQPVFTMPSGVSQPGMITPAQPGMAVGGGVSQPGMTTPVPAQQPNAPGAVSPTVAAPRPGMTTPPQKPPGGPGGD